MASSRSASRKAAYVARRNNHPFCGRVQYLAHRGGVAVRNGAYEIIIKAVYGRSGFMQRKEICGIKKRDTLSSMQSSAQESIGGVTLVVAGDMRQARRMGKYHEAAWPSRNRPSAVVHHAQ